MKKVFYASTRMWIIALALVIMIVSGALLNAPISAAGASNEFTANAESTTNSSLLNMAACVPDVTDLTAGQTHKVGTLTVWNDETNLYVKYDLTNDGMPYAGCQFGTLHLWAGTDLTNLPKVANGPNAGTPIPGQFPYKYDAMGQTSHTFTIPLADVKVDVNNNGCGSKLYVVAHAEVANCTGNGIGSGETAFGGDLPGSGPRWWYYNDYTICCDTPPPPPVFSCKTAFAKGGWVFTTDRKSNPESLPSLNLIRNRWGWAINVTNDGATTYDVWAGAGLNYTTNGVRVGTVTVEKSGNQVAVRYNLTVPMEELHIYVGDCRPTTTAPGQYGYTRYFDPKVMSHEATFTVSDGACDGAGFGSDGIWVIAHAVACVPVP